MYNGKRAKSSSTKHFKRSLALIASLVLMLSIGLGTTIAWLTDKTADVRNVFQPAYVPPVINETEPTENEERPNVKENVTVTNVGNVSAYIRAAIIATWQDDAGNISPETPALGTDYSMVLVTKKENQENKWSDKTGGYYYYLEPVEAKGITDVLIDEATPLKSNGEYHLVIEILTQTIQSEGTDSKGNKPIELVWGVDIENGELKAATISK